MPNKTDKSTKRAHLEKPVEVKVDPYARPSRAGSSAPAGNGSNPQLPSAAWWMIGPALAIIAVAMAIWVHSVPPQGDAMTAAGPQSDDRFDPSVFTDPTPPAKPFEIKPLPELAGPDEPRLIAAHNARLADGSELPGKDYALPAGQLHLKQGRVEFAMPSGVKVTLEGHCVFEPTSDNSIRLEHGTLSADVPDEAIGFYVQTPHAKVTAIEDDAEVDADNENSEILKSGESTQKSAL